MIQKTYKTHMTYKTHQAVSLLLALLAIFLTGCNRQQMNIQGISSLHELEGRMLYLRIYKDGDLATIDSSRIIHGKFQFTGPQRDTCLMANLFIGDESLMPVVIDGSPLRIILSENERKVEGSALNDTLFAFIRRKTALDRQLAELPRRESHMILEGMDHDEILMQLNQEAAQLGAQEDNLVMGFIKANMDNVLGPGVFMIVTSSLPYPMLNPRIEELITFASPAFLNDPYVQEYIRMARENEEAMHQE